jgi:L-2-hydroxyglutarate oxidase LhgO
LRAGADIESQKYEITQRLKKMDHVDTCIVGAGVVGLAIGRQLSSANGDLLILDSETHYGQGISSRNSEVVHAGIYYPKDSLKAKLCVRGKHLLYEYCESRGVSFNPCGKLIVATIQDEESALDDIQAKAMANGVDDLVYWSSNQISTQEPEVLATLGLFSPSTGIVSAHELMTAYLGDVESAGGSFVGNSHVASVRRRENDFVLKCIIQGEEYEVSCRLLINAAGLGARQLGLSIEGVDPNSVPPLYYCKGSYFALSHGMPFSHLIYPVPEKSGAGLGVHATIDLGGQVKFGPDVEYLNSEDYEVSESKLDQYYEAVRRYFPRLEKDALVPGYAGIRPKLHREGESPADFVIQGSETHGVPNLIQLYGIESPGLTSSMAIAEYVKLLCESVSP